MNKKISITVFVAIETIIFLTFMLLDIIDIRSSLLTWLKFISIVLCLFYSLLIPFWFSKTEGWFLVSLALAFTVFADIFLLLLDFIEPGILLFCIVQMIYLIWLCRLEQRLPKKGELEDRGWKKKSAPAYIARALLYRFSATLLLYLGAVFVHIPQGFMIFVLIFYGVSFLDNIRRAVWMMLTRRYQERGFRLGLLTGGLILFFFCDICVGLYNLPRFAEGAEPVTGLAGSLISLGMWMFYLPGQVMITLSNTSD